VNNDIPDPCAGNQGANPCAKGEPYNPCQHGPAPRNPCTDPSMAKTKNPCSPP
jgi:hypothetical protein